MIDGQIILILAFLKKVLLAEYSCNNISIKLSTCKEDFIKIYNKLLEIPNLNDCKVLTINTTKKGIMIRSKYELLTDCFGLIGAYP